MRTEASLVTDSEREAATAPPPAVGSFEQFFRNHYPDVVRIADRVVGDSHLAEDVAQDAFIAAQRKFPLPDGSDHAAAWVRTAAAHLGLNAVRSRRRRDKRQDLGDKGPSPVGPEELALEREAEVELRRALARLPRHSALVLILRHSGLSYSEVAEAMGVKVAHVGTMLQRAEAALRKEVGRGTRA
jgi:RNA polymerase sigma-70 factor (ECF subfamily)